MSLKATNWAWEQELKPGPKLVLMSIADWANGKHVACEASLSQISDRCCVSKSTVIRYLETLEEDGFLKREYRTRENGGLARNYFTILVGDDKTPSSNLTLGSKEAENSPGEEGTPWCQNDTSPSSTCDTSLVSSVTLGKKRSGNIVTPLKSPQGEKLSISTLNELNAWEPEQALIDDIVASCGTLTPVVLYAVGVWKKYQAARKLNLRAPGVTFERYFIKRHEQLTSDWQEQPVKDWTEADWRAKAFLDHSVSEVKSAQAWPNTKQMPYPMHTVRNQWDTERCGPEPWKADNLVPSAVLADYAPWWDDKIAAQQAKERRAEMAEGLAQGKPVRVAKEWRPSQEESQELQEKFELHSWEVSDQAAAFAAWYNRMGQEKGWKVKNPLEKFDAWLFKRANDIHQERGKKNARQMGSMSGCGGGAPAKTGRDPVKVAEWLEFLGDVGDDVQQRMVSSRWSTLLHHARPAAQVNPWEAYNGEIPIEVYSTYARAWGWKPIPAKVLEELGT